MPTGRAGAKQGSRTAFGRLRDRFAVSESTAVDDLQVDVATDLDHAVAGCTDDRFDELAVGVLEPPLH
jgi:hypothetical protein